MILEKRYIRDQLKPVSDEWLKNWKGSKITLDDIVNGRGFIVKMRPGELHGKPGVPQPAAKPQSAHVFAFGKFKGRSILEVFEENPGYVRWAMKEVNGFAAKAKAAGVMDGEEEEDIDIFA